MIGLVDNKNNILVCSVTKDICEKFQAGKIIASITKDLGLKGGGSKHMAITNFENVDLLKIQIIKYLVIINTKWIKRSIIIIKYKIKTRIIKNI